MEMAKHWDGAVMHKVGPGIGVKAKHGAGNRAGHGPGHGDGLRAGDGQSQSSPHHQLQPQP